MILWGLLAEGTGIRPAGNVRVSLQGFTKAEWGSEPSGADGDRQRLAGSADQEGW